VSTRIAVPLNGMRSHMSEPSGSIAKQSMWLRAFL
jgi:hypothetical protein